jgi:hypothetical protein
MSARELIEWAAFERVNGPILAHDRIDVAAAHICSALASALRAQWIEPDAFMPRWDDDVPERPRQSVEDMIGAVRSLQRKKGTRDDRS